jgi:hypothetical protein
MLNITTTQNGFELNDLTYLFEGIDEVVSNSQVHVGTNQGIILLDLTCTINEVEFTDINLFLSALKRK